MFKKYPLRLTSLNLVTLLHIHAVVATSALRNDIAAFVPSCALDCVFSFLNVNYDSETLSCGDTTLDSICATSSLSGFTLGEGVMQCMTAAKSVDSCSEEEASESDIREAYKICEGRPNAIEGTHGVVTATLLIDPDTGKLVFPKPTKIPNEEPETSKACSTSSATSATSTSTESTTSTSTTSNTLPTTLITAPSKTEPLPSESSTSSTETPAEATETSAPAAAFSSGQLAGISLGAICAAAGVILGIVFLTRYYLRRRRHRKSKNSLASHRDTWDYRFDKRPHSGESSFTGSHLHRHTGPYPAHILPGQGYNRKSWRPSAIGLAISPSRHGDQATTPIRTPTRPISKLLPAKPDLPPVPPKDGSPPPIVVRQATMSPHLQAEPTVPFIQQMVTNPAQPGRDKPQPPRLVIPEPYNAPQEIAELPAHDDHAVRESTLTEFEEDGHRSTSPAATIWPKPSANVTFASTAYHAAENNPNWTTFSPKRRSASENDISTPMSAEPKIGTAQSALVATARKTDIPSKSTTPRLPPEPKTPNLQQASSQPKTPKTMPSPLFSRHPNPRSSSQPLSNNQASIPTAAAAAANIAPNRPARSRATSTDSGITCISTSSETSEDVNPSAPQPAYNLSPVAESPQSRSANSNTNPNIQDRSPVSHPNLQPSRGTLATTGQRPFSGRGGRKLVPPPRRPIQYHNSIRYNPNQPPQPLLYDNNTNYSYNSNQPQPQPIPPTNTPPYPPDNNNINNHHQTNAAYAPTMRIVSPSPAPVPAPAPAHDDRSILPSARRKRPPSHLPHPFPMHPQPRPTRGRGTARGGYYPQPQPQPQPYRQQPAYHPMPIPQPYKTTPHQTEHEQQVHNHWLPPRPQADSPSLLAKRIGTERAANMTMPVIQKQRSTAQGQWQQTPPMSQQQQQATRPACPVTPELPSTPTWLPRLTPTRRGDDLFLNVG